MKLTKKEQIARRKLCLPLDGLETLKQLEDRVKELNSIIGIFKIGKESYTKFGPAAIEIVQSYGAEVFLDLKYHDIPVTVKGAAKAATQLGVYMFNVHASGGKEMLEAAIEGIESGYKSYLKKPKILGVTVLTSIDQKILNEELGIKGKVETQVKRLAELSAEAGLDGIICSAKDLRKIKKKLPKDFWYVTPGIKGITTSAGEDQKRVYSPGEAIKDGATILIVGRAITNGKNSKERLKISYEIILDMVKFL